MKQAALKLSDHFTYEKLFRFVLPSIVMMVFTSIYTVVDGLFVLNIAGKDAFTGVNFIYPVIGMISSIGFMIGNGGAALVGKKLGEQDEKTANKYFSTFMLVCPLLGFLIATPIFIFMKPLITLMGGSGVMAEEALKYGQILIWFSPLFLTQMAFQSFLIVSEKTRLNTAITIGCGILNIILDAILVAGFNLGVIGAVCATGVCQALGAIIPFIYFLNKNNTSLLKMVKPKLEIKPLLKCFGNGSSEFITNVSISFVSMIYNTQLIKYIGNDGVAAYGTIMYVCLFFLAVFFGYNMGVGPLISYNFGAKNKDELKNLTNKSLKIIVIFSLAMTALSYALSYPISIAFGGGDINLQKLTFHSFLFFSSTFVFCGLPIFTSAFFTALNDGLTSATVSIFRTLLFPMLFVFTLPLALQSDGIWSALICVEASSTFVAIILLWVKNKKYKYF